MSLVKIRDSQINVDQFLMICLVVLVVLVLVDSRLHFPLERGFIIIFSHRCRYPSILIPE